MNLSLTDWLDSSRKVKKLKRIEKLQGNLDIAVLTLEGVIASSSEEGGRYRYVTESLSELAQIKPDVLLLRINSPGGTTGASEEIYRSVMALKRNCGTKVVVLMEDVCASGGLYVAMAGDRILAKAGTLTGSIGVILQGIEYKEVLDLLKVKTRTIKSGKFKDILSPTRSMLPEEESLLTEMIMDVYEQFVQVVAAGRKMSVEEVKAFADGRVMTGAQALRLGLVDALGGYDDAVEVCRKLAAIPEDEEHEMESWVGPEKNLLAKFGLASQVSVLNDFAISAKLSGMPLWLMPRF